MLTWEKNQVAASVRFLAARRWQWGANKVQAFLKLLQQENMILIAQTQASTVITILAEKQIQRQIQRQIQSNPIPSTVSSDSLYTPEHADQYTVDTRPDTKQKESRKKEEKKNTVIPYGHDSPLFKELYDKWIIHRRELKKPLTASTIVAQNEMLKKYPVHEALEMIRQAIEKSWSGFYELKEADKLRVKPEKHINTHAHLKQLRGPGDFWNELDYLNYLKEDGSITIEQVDEKRTRFLKAL